MKPPIFSRDDFTLCDVPVPLGYPQSQTHAGIYLYKGCWFLTTSPYPAKRYSKCFNYLRVALHKFSNGKLINPIPADRFENPCLYMGLTIQNAPTSFKLLYPKPLMDTPKQPLGGHAYNSDPDLYIEEGKAYILNRTMTCTINDLGEKDYKSQLYLITGQLSNNCINTIKYTDFGTWLSSSVVSHSLTKFHGQYFLMYLDTISALDGKTFRGLYLKSADKIEDLKNAEERQVNVISDNLLPWHMSLFHYNGRLYSIIASVERGIPKGKIWQMLGEFSDDLSRLIIYNKPLTDYCSYRGSATITPQGIFVLYSPTLNEKIRGSKSVDGRDIIMAQMPMSELLNKIKN